MAKHWVEEIFEKCGAILNGHFIFTSRRHSGIYLDKTMVYPDTENVFYICREIAFEMEKGGFQNLPPDQMVKFVYNDCINPLLREDLVEEVGHRLGHGAVVARVEFKVPHRNPQVDVRLDMLVAGPRGIPHRV